MACAVLVLAGAATQAPAAAGPGGEELRYRYLANRSAYAFGMDESERAARAITAEDWTVTGLRFQTDESFTLTVDDAAVVAPFTVPILIINFRPDGGRDVDVYCATDSAPVDVAVRTNQARIAVLIYNHTESPWSGCRGATAGTTGTISVRL